MSGPTFNYQRVIEEQTDLRSASVYEGNGVWAYTFSVAIPSTYLAPINDSTSLTDGELTGQTLLAGTYSVGMQLDGTYQDINGQEFTDAGTAVSDFLFGGATTLAPREVSQADNCNVCHTELRAHDNKRKDVRLCVLCHTAGAEDSNESGATPGTTIEFKVMIHKLHNGSHLPSVLGVSTNTSGTRVYPSTVADTKPLEYVDDEGHVADFSAATFPVWPNLNVAMPKDLGYSALAGTDPDGSAGPLLSAKGCEDQIRTGATACAKCHGDPDANGSLTAPEQGQLAFAQPSRRACGACHDDIDWSRPYVANGATMDPQPDDSGCIDCHKDTAANQTDVSLKPLSVTEAHLHPLLAPAIDPGVNSVISSISGGTGPNSRFQNGDTPTVTFSLTNDGGSDIGLATMDSCSTFFFGPTTNRQLVMPVPSPNGMSLNPFDFAGRLQATSTSGKGTMSKVFLGATAAAEILVVQFTSSTAFSVNRIDRTTGTVLGSLGTGSLPVAAGTANTFPSGASVSAFDLGDALSTGTVQITFTSATHFDVSGSASGSGDLPATTSASTRFSSATFSFNIAVGSAPFAAGNTINIGLFRGGAANPVLFAVTGGRTVFASGDRFYYEVVPNAASYTLKIPMDMVFEFIADTGATPTASTLLGTAGNLPVYWGRQQLWEVAPTASPNNASTTSTATVGTYGRYVDVVPATGFANNDLVVVDDGAVLGTREYVQIAPARVDDPDDPNDGAIATATDTTVRLYFKTPLRYSHSSGITITKVSQTFKQEGAASYTLNPATGAITSGTTPFTANRAMVMSYRTDARFGYKRHAGDVVQAKFVPPANDSTDLGQEQGDWQGLAYQSGTYTADIWFYRNIDLGVQNELQTYRSTSNAGTIDFLYGSATTIEPREVISASANCYACHDDVLFHGGGRRGVDACLTCHGISGAEDKPRWDTPKVGTSTTDTAQTPGVAIEFRQMLHKIHMGAELAKAVTYTVVGNGGNPSTYGEVEFPAMPAGVRQCVRCHGNDAWKTPATRTYTAATSLVKTWGVVCGSCHDSDPAEAHISANTTGFGVESCAVCHGVGREFAVEKVHLPR